MKLLSSSLLIVRRVVAHPRQACITTATKISLLYSIAALTTMTSRAPPIDRIADSTAAAGATGRARKERSARTPDDPKTAVSKRLAYILRHGAADHGLSLRPDGFAILSDVLALRSFGGVTEAQVDEIVATCPKKRYSTTVDAAGTKWIRANQGHSLKDTIDADLLCTPVLSVEVSFGRATSQPLSLFVYTRTSCRRSLLLYTARI
jgi:RNA:NAD 2'-phosphotransferase (TPT1/KptA family)